MFIELNKKKDKTGRRAFTISLHEIYPDDTLVDNTGTEYNRNGISWIRQYVEPNLDSIHGMSLTVEFIDEERSQIYGHGETDLVGGDDGLPLFENATVVGYFEKGWIDTIEVNGVSKTVVLGSGYIDEMRYPKFVKWLFEKINNGETVFGSIEFFKKEGNEKILYLDGYKEKGRVPTEYMYSGFALLDIVTPADDTATLLELNTFKKNNEEDEKMDEKMISQFSDIIKSTITETNSKNSEYETQIAELNSQLSERDATIVELNTTVEQLNKALTDLKNEQETYWEQRQILEKEIAELKVAKRLEELDKALEVYSEEEQGYAKAEIEKFKEDPLSDEVEINTITTIIKANSYDAMKAKEAEDAKINAEINSTKTVESLEDIFGAVANEETETDDVDFSGMFN